MGAAEALGAEVRGAEVLELDGAGSAARGVGVSSSVYQLRIHLN